METIDTVDQSTAEERKFFLNQGERIGFWVGAILGLLLGVSATLLLCGELPL